MNSAYIFVFSLSLLHLGSYNFVQAVVGKCNYELVLLWSRETGHVPFAATPIIADINLDGHPEVIAAPFADQITVVQGHNGQPLPKAKWPQQLVESTVHASPVTYDVDNDGKPDIIIITSDGHFHFYDHKGNTLENATFKLPGLQIAKNWHLEALTVEHTDIHNYILDDPPLNNKPKDGYIVVDPHVLGSAIIADINADNVIEEMVIPVSYYFNDEVYEEEDVRAEKGVTADDVNKFLAGGIVLFNLTSLSIIRTTHLELTRLDAEYPGYVMFTPTVVDLDGNHGPLEVIVGSSAGQIHVIGTDGKNRDGWPVSRDRIHGQVSTASCAIGGQILVADIDQDGKMDIIAMDTSSNVMCYQSDGQISWETTISGSSTNGPRVADIEQDGKLDVIIGTNDGQVWILEGTDGHVKKQWPFRVGKGLGATPLITQLNQNSVIDVVILGEDSHLHIVSGDGKKCRHAISLGSSSLVGILSYDLVPTAPGMELLIATKDGVLMCLGGRSPVDVPREKVVLDGVPAETRSVNDFMYTASRVGILLRENIIGVLDVTGTSLDVYFTIFDSLPVRGRANTYRVNVYLGNERKATSRFEKPGAYYLTIACPSIPTQGLIRVVMTTRHGIVYQDSATLQFNVSFLKDLKWLLACPFIAMTSVLLLIYGYPAADLLPISHKSKAR